MLSGLLCLSYAARAADVPDVGSFLVATSKTPDSGFARTVILLVHYDAQGVVGLIVNRPSKAKLPELMPKTKYPEQTIYAGGPVPFGVHTLIRARTKPDGASTVLEDVYFISGQKEVERFQDRAKAPVFRVYLGYAGWTGPQLENELKLGFWSVTQGESKYVFDDNPATLWQRIANRALARR